MNRMTSDRILDIQEQIRSDQLLIGEYEAAQVPFMKLLHDLPKDQRDIMMDYLGICVEIHLRMLEKAVEMK